MLRFDKATLFWFLQSNLSVRLSNKTCDSKVVLFFEYIKIVSIFVLYFY